MSSPGPDAFYSPVPQFEPPPPQGPPSWVSPSTPNGSPVLFHNTAQPPPVRKTTSRHGWVLLTAAILMTVLAGATAIGLSVGRSTQVITDGQGRVSVRVPQTWFDDTELDPPSMSSAAGEKTEDRIPDLETGSFSGARYLQVSLDEPGPDGLVAAHQLSVDDVCSQWTCRTRGAATQVTIDGQPGLEQVATHYSEADGSAISVVLTVQSADRLISAVGVRESVRDEPPSAEPLLRVLHTLTLH